MLIVTIRLQGELYVDLKVNSPNRIVICVHWETTYDTSSHLVISHFSRSKTTSATLIEIRQVVVVLGVQLR